MPYRAAGKSDLPGIQNLAGRFLLKEKLTTLTTGIYTCQVCRRPDARRDLVLS
jgi:hypothetical protein